MVIWQGHEDGDMERWMGTRSKQTKAQHSTAKSRAKNSPHDSLDTKGSGC